MMNERMYDLAIEALPDGGIRLTQSADSPEGPDVVDLHPCQLRHVAEQVGLLKPAPAWPRGFQKRMERVRRDLAYLASPVWLDEIISRLGDGLAFEIGISACLDNFDDLLIEIPLDADDSPSNTDAPAEDIVEAAPDKPAGQSGLF